MFDGETWSILDTLSLHATGLIFHGGSLYACGRRLSLSHPRSGGVYRWDADHWTSIGLADVDGSFPFVTSFVVFDGQLVAAGSFSSIEGTPAANVASWDGQTWEAMDRGVSIQTIHSLAICGGDLYAGGDFRDVYDSYVSVARWGDDGWTPVSSLPMHALVLGCADNQLLAGGSVLEFPGFGGRR